MSYVLNRKKVSYYLCSLKAFICKVIWKDLIIMSPSQHFSSAFAGRNAKTKHCFLKSWP